MLFLAEGLIGGGGLRRWGLLAGVRTALRRPGGGPGLAWLGFATASSAAATAIFSADELEILYHDAHLAALAAALLVFPLVVFESAFDEDRLALLEVLVDDFAGSAEGGTVDESYFL